MHKSPPDVCTSPWARHGCWPTGMTLVKLICNGPPQPPGICTSPWARHHTWALGYWYGPGQINMQWSPPASGYMH